MKTVTPPIILSIAGSDPSAGAGIQQDLKTMTALGAYAATAITAVTAQNTLGVQDVMPLPPDIVRTQILAVFADLEVRAVKIGMLPNAPVAAAVCQTLRQAKERGEAPLHIVYDPVMVSTSGRQLMEADAIAYVAANLFPICTLVTPNIPEAEVLCGHPIAGMADVHRAGGELVRRYGTHFLIKGGHASEGRTLTDSLYMADGSTATFSATRIVTPNLHGTGCTLSSAIATLLAKGLPMTEAVAQARDFLTQCIVEGRDCRIGHGNGPLRCGW